MRDGTTALRCGLLALLGACGGAAPVPELPAGRAEAVAVVDDRAILLLTDRERHAWLASVDEAGAPRWVVPVPAPFPGHATEHAQLAGAGADGLLRRLDPSGSREELLGFSAIDGAPRWQTVEGVEVEAVGPELRWFDGGQSIDLFADEPAGYGEPGDVRAWRVEARDLTTGALQFRRTWPRDPELAPLRFAEHVAVRAESGWVTYRRSDGLPRARLAIDGPACQLGGSILGFDGEAVLAVEVARPEAPPRVLMSRLPDLMRARDPSLVSCHRRGDGVVLQLHGAWRSYVLALAADGSVAGWGRLVSQTPLELAPEVGEVVPLLGGPGPSQRVLALHRLTAHLGEPTELLRLDPAILPARFRAIEPFPGGYLAWSWTAGGPAELVSIDAITGAVTGAATVLAMADPIQPQQLVDGRLWLIGSVDAEGPLRLRALDLRSLRPLGPGGFEVVDRTAEAQAAWLPPTEVVKIADEAEGAARERPCTSRPNAPFLLPPWDLAQLQLAGAQRAEGGLEAAALELLAWDSDSVDRHESPGAPNEQGPRVGLADTGQFASAVMVARDVDASGPRWWLVPLRSSLGPWEGVGRVTPLRRRPTPRDVERAIAASGGDVEHVLAGRGGPFPEVADLDRRRFLALTGVAPGPERCAPKADAGRAMSGRDGPTQRQRQQGGLAPQRPRG